MRNPIACIIISSALGTSVLAQDAVTYSLDGRIGLGYLREETGRPFGDGYQFKGTVAKVELTGRAEVSVFENLRFGALGRLSYLRGDQSTYDRTSLGVLTGASGSDFGGSEIDLAVFAASPIVTLSYGDMETAFDLATREVEQGGSLIDGGSAVWMNLGDGAGSAAPRGGFSGGGPSEGPDLRTLRLDLQVGELTFSASRSDGETSSGREVEVDAAGAIWRHETDAVTLFAGAGYDEGTFDRFRSLSFGFTSGGLNVVVNRVDRSPIVINFAEPDYDTSYDGLSLSYDFGDVTLGMAQSSQRDIRNGVFTGTARAVFASWEARENVAVDFEFSESTYTGGGDNTQKASFAVAMEF